MTDKSKPEPMWEPPKPQAPEPEPVKYWVNCGCGGRMALWANIAPPKYCSQCGKQIRFSHQAKRIING